MDDAQVTTKEEENEVQETEAGDTTEYTLDKQELDQERSNTRRAREELTSVSEQLESVNERAGNLETELNELKRSNEEQKTRLEAAQQTEQEKLDEMDPELVDAQVIKNIQRIEGRLKSQREDFQQERAVLLKKMSELSDKATQYENERTETAQIQEHQNAVDSVLNRVEDSLKLHNVTTPGQYRTEAMKIADDLVDTGQRSKPSSILEGVKLMEECYLNVINKHNKKKGVSVDGGKSGLTTSAKAKGQRKTGSLDEVASDMLKDKSWQED